MKRKRTTRKTTHRKIIRRKRILSSPYQRWLQTRVYAYDDEVYERPTAHQTCLNCYMTFQYDWNRKFDIRDRFCPSCRRAMPFKKWLVLRKFYRILEDACNKREPENDVTKGSVMQYVNGVFQSLHHNKSREFLLDSITCTVDVAHLGTPIDLSQLMELYDLVTGAKKKRRLHKRRRLQTRKNIV